MALIGRERTRTIQGSTDTTLETTSLVSNALAFVQTSAQFFYVGFKHKFAARYFQMGTVNTNASVVTVKFWNGTAFEAVEDLQDQTNGFKASGFMSWKNVSTWEKVAQSGIEIELFWIELTVSADLSGGTTLEAVLAMFSDDDQLRQYYPELITDTSYLPTGRTDFLEQHEAARDLVLNRLEKKQAIVVEGDIIELNKVSLAAVHACAWIILNPISSSEESVNRANQAFSSMQNMLNQAKLDTDIDGDGIVDDRERERRGISEIVRR